MAKGRARVLDLVELAGTRTLVASFPDPDDAVLYAWGHPGTFVVMSIGYLGAEHGTVYRPRVAADS